MTIKAIWKDTVIAETENFKILEGVYYFPPESVVQACVQQNGSVYIDRWKGKANFYDVHVGKLVNKNAALTYKEADENIKEIEHYFSFLNGIEIVKINDDQ